MYFEDDFYLIPQQAGKVRNLPFKVVTFCYHPNTMNDAAFEALESFFKSKSERFVAFGKIEMKKRDLSLIDEVLKKMYFAKRQ